MEINIAKDFSPVPAGRNLSDGKFSGERFREELLTPKLNELPDGEKLVIVIDGIEGMGSSFVEEAFGGLIRKNFTEEQLREKIKIIASDSLSLYEEIIWRYIGDAQK